MKKIYAFFLAFLSFLSCKLDRKESPIESKEKVSAGQIDGQLLLPEWAKSANIYEVNLRQYTAEGSFNSFVEHLPRLKKMGVDILWFMPIYPISQKNRKGSLGSYYAVSDYKNVNPEHGTLNDFKNMVKAIHDHGMYIILDWVPNHTGWDNRWINSNPEWYTRDSLGNVIDPINAETGESWGWTDVADLNYDNSDMRTAQIDALKFWLTETGVDGFRHDVAHGVPQDFWDQHTKELLKARTDIFLLAESEVISHRNNGTFHMNYSWSFHHLLNDIAKGDKTIADIDLWLDKSRKDYNQGIFMQFTSNHDENSWNGTEFERMGDGHEAFAVLTCTFEGMPLIYSGQEEPIRRRLKFFEKDDIGFKNFEKQDFYQTLLDLKHRNQALWNGTYGGFVEKIADSKSIYSFIREKNEDKVAVLINLSPEASSTTIKKHISGLRDVFTEKSVHYHIGDEVKLGPWEYIVASNR